MPKSDQGVSSSRYQVIPRTLIFITRGQEVLLIKGAPSKRLWANQYNGIGGHVERGEDVLSSARRELAEEAGITVEDLRLVGTILVDASPEAGISIYLLKGEYKEGFLVQSEEGALEWVHSSRLSEYPLVEDLKMILPRVLSLRNQDAPLSARSYYDSHDRLQVVFGDECER